MRVHVLQHVPFEGVGSIGWWLSTQAATVRYTRSYDSTPLPPLRNLDLIVAMGGPMSVNDATALPWLAEEKRFIADAIRRGIPTVGICLGAQLIASALGARVYPAPNREIGWFEIKACAPTSACFRFRARTRVFHWHGETFDLPKGATLLARSAACQNQAFQFGSNVVGLQFHLEATRETASALIDNCRHDLAPEPYVQSEAALRGVPDAEYERANAIMVDVLSYVTREARVSS